MRPLVIITTFNRKQETASTLEALEESVDLSTVEIVIVDNGSTDGTTDLVMDWEKRLAEEEAMGWRGPLAMIVYTLTENIGCPRALNYALERHRKIGQPVVKLDNDVQLLIPNWPQKMQGLIKNWEGQGRFVAMVSAYYDGVLDRRVSGIEQLWNGYAVYLLHLAVGHAVWHTGAFMDAVDYFDVLTDDHLYGFEDLIMSHKARLMGWDTLVWKGWQIENLQRHNSLGGLQNEHVNKMRPLYDRRVAALECGGPIWTGPDGRPAGETVED